MTDKFFALYWCLCASICFIINFYSSIILMASQAIFSRKHSTLPTTPKMSEINYYCIFLRINFLKISGRKRWKWHFRDAKFKNFS